MSWDLTLDLSDLATISVHTGKGGGKKSQNDVYKASSGLQIKAI